MDQGIREVQLRLRAAGFDPGPADGLWGPRTSAALDLALLPYQPQATSLAWGAKVSAEFRNEVFALCQRQQLVPDYLMACMAFETAETFRPDIRNAAGSGATGLIQFMPTTARGMGTTTEALAGMTAVQQLAWVEAYFKPYRGRLKSLSDHYLAILWPAAIGRAESSVLWDRATRPTTYRQNLGLDANRDGIITKGEAAARVQGKLDKGLLPGRVWRRD
jgi:peptidoglycan hydrolase-like protein with peptidoglycan-binding domain